MKKLFFLLNELREFNFMPLIEKYLSTYEVNIGETMPSCPESYDLIILWNYQKIIPVQSDYKNLILFHSSDLPKGKGWAPIYYAIAENQKEHTITGLYVDGKVDSGEMIVKAKFQIKDNYIASYLRKWDQEIIVSLIKKIIEVYPYRSFKGETQVGKETYYKRRYPEDNCVNVENKLGDLINHLRACESQHPAYFYFNDIKYNVFVEPAEMPSFPDDLEITFFK